MAVIDVAGFVADLKDHAVDHGFHVHDERHFVETYSLRQAWEVDLHPEEGCGGPLDLHLALEVDPRMLLASRTPSSTLPDDDEPPDEFHFPLTLHVGAAAAAARTRPAACSPPSSRASAAPTCRSRCRPSTRSPRSPTRPSAASPSSPASRSRSPGSSLGEELLCDVLDRCLGSAVPARPRPGLARRVRSEPGPSPASSG